MGSWVSSVQIHDGYAYFPWTELVDKKRYLVSYNFTRVHLESGKVETKSVAKGGGNTVPSFGIINDTVLFAYHEPQTRLDRKTFEKVPQDYNRNHELHYAGYDSKVITKCFPLKEFFSKESK